MMIDATRATPAAPRRSPITRHRICVNPAALLAFGIDMLIALVVPTALSLVAPRSRRPRLRRRRGRAERYEVSWKTAKKWAGHDAVVGRAGMADRSSPGLCAA